MSNVSPVGAFFLFVFFLSLVGFYIIIRRKLMRLQVAGFMSGIINFVSLLAFGLSNEKIGDELAVLGAVIVGIGFTGAMLTMAAFFENNQSATLSAYDASLRQRPPNPPQK